MLGSGRLLHLQSVDDLADRALLEREIVEYLSPARLGDGVEGVGSGRGSCHERYNTFRYGNMSSIIFVPQSEARYELQAYPLALLFLTLEASNAKTFMEVISGDPLLVKSALDAVRQWKYRPTPLNGEPVEVDTTIDVIFSLSR
jgi:hypothetical protein